MTSLGVKSGFISLCEVGQLSQRLLELVRSLKKIDKDLACQNPEYCELTLDLDHGLIPGYVLNCLASGCGWLLDSVS